MKKKIKKNNNSMSLVKKLITKLKRNSLCYLFYLCRHIFYLDKLGKKKIKIRRYLILIDSEILDYKKINFINKG